MRCRSYGINWHTGIYDFIKECCYKPIVELSFDTTINLYIGLAKTQQALRKWTVLTQHNFDKTPLPAQAPEFLNVSILYPIENTPCFRILNFGHPSRAAFHAVSSHMEKQIR
jgi:hypothetical protein